jgi:glucokinase
LVTRSQLAKQLGLSGASVSRIVRRLVRDGSVEELEGEGGSSGRRPSFLRFVPRVGAIIAVDLGGTKCHGALADLAGDVLHEDFRPTGGPERATATVVKCLGALRSQAAAEGVPIHAVVVGIPALIDPETGLAAAGPNVGWEGFDVLGTLRPHVPEPLEVDNDANLAALGQAWRGQAIGVRSFVTLTLGTGIGGGVVIDGRLVRGFHNAAGEIGHLLLGRNQLRGQRGSRLGFEALASGPALGARAAALLEKSSESTLARGEFDTPDVFAAAAAGDPIGERVIAELLDYVAMVVVNITALIDPELIILDGSVGQALEPWLAPLQRLVKPNVFKPPEVVVSKLGPNATLVGAIERGLTLASQREAPAMLQLAETAFKSSRYDDGRSDHARARSH